MYATLRVSYQDSTVWERDNFSGWKSKYTVAERRLDVARALVLTWGREPTKSSTIAQRRVEWWKCQIAWLSEACLSKGVLRRIGTER